MWIKRTKLETGINGIADEYKEMYGIQINDGYVSLNNEIEIPLEAIEKVVESQIEYEIQTKGIYVNLSKKQKSMKMLVRC
ncbi:MAG: hypothetical protein ABFC34_16955 [Methanobacterium sp.]